MRAIAKGIKEEKMSENSVGLWTDQVIDHFSNPRNLGKMEDCDACGVGGDASCGDTMTLFIKVKDDVIVKSSFLVQGCVAAIASSSMTTEMVQGKTLQEALSITAEDISEALGGLIKSKFHCSVLGVEAIKNAINQYQDLNK